MTPQFPQRKIGNDHVSAIGLGCMGMSIPRSDGTTDDSESLKVLTLAADMGITFWDTSDMYGPFTNELLIGRWFKETGRRDEIFLATKFGFKFTCGKPALNSTPEWIKEACEGSLQRLGTDRIDLYQQHRVDPSTPIEKTIQALLDLKKDGKVLYFGLSECSARTLERACKVHPIATAQMEYSPFALEIEEEETNFLNTARKLGVKIVAYGPLGRGFVTGAIKTRDALEDTKKIHPRFSEENFGHNLKIVVALAEIAKAKGCTPGQLALAWCLAQGEDFIPIPGTKTLKYLKENASAIDIVISKEDDEKVRKAIENIGGRKGERYPAAYLSWCFGDTAELE